jgi:alpha-tubulin suppressor-like RCC1 family protein
MRSLHFVVALLMLALATTAQAATAGAVTQLGFRYGHRCVLHDDGAVDCVSESAYRGALLGTDGEVALRPVRMIERGATRLVVGDFSICAIVAGALDCWSKIPADGKKPSAIKPIIASGVTDVAVGSQHACAVAQGAVLCWGSDFHGQSGHSDGDYSEGVVQHTPWRVIDRGATQVAAGGEMSCATVDGGLWCWGHTLLAREPMGDPNARDQPPVRVFEQDVTAVAAGDRHVCAIVSGALWCWGDNSKGQVGIGVAAEQAAHAAGTLPVGTRGTFPVGEQTCSWQYWNQLQCAVMRPVKVIDAGVHAVTARADGTCALTDSGMLCWGANGQGQLGIAPAADVLKPTIALSGKADLVVMDASRTCAVLAGGALSCTRPCGWLHDKPDCTEPPGFVAGDPNNLAGLQARAGVWRGSIGGAQVMVCVQAHPEAGSDYYYLAHRFSIALARSDNSGARWYEAGVRQRVYDTPPPVATWSLGAPSGGRMQGTWASSDGKRRLPIRLVRVAAPQPGAGDSCGWAFEGPRVKWEERAIVPQPDSMHLVSVLNGHVSMTELPLSLPHAERFNKAMHDWLDGKIAEYFGCASAGGMQGFDFNASYEIELLAPPWLVAREGYSAYCGGAHPDGGVAGYALWDLATGKPVEAWDWLKESHWDYMENVARCARAEDCVRRPPPELAALIVARYAKDNADNGNCEGAMDGDAIDYLLLHPSERGLVFSTTFAHVIQACDEDIEIDWDTLAPYLTAQGRSAMNSLRHAAKPGK